MNCFLFVNPLSGRYARRSVRDLVQGLTRAGLDPQVHAVTTPDEVIPCCSAINGCNGSPLVIIAAGDGTVNAVVNGIQPGKATLAVLPLGTSNVLAAELGISSVDDGIRRIAAKVTRPLSVGVLHLEGQTRRFVLMAGIGLDGAVVRDVWPLGKRLLKQGAYGVSALLNTLRWDKGLISIRSQSGSFDCHSVIICSASRYGGNFVLAPDQDPFAPQLTAVIINRNQRRTYLRLAYELWRGRVEESNALCKIPGDGIEIIGVKPIQLDGDFVGYSPARITVMPDFAQLIV